MIVREYLHNASYMYKVKQRKTTLIRKDSIKEPEPNRWLQEYIKEQQRGREKKQEKNSIMGKETGTRSGI